MLSIQSTRDSSMGGAWLCVEKAGNGAVFFIWMGQALCSPIVFFVDLTAAFFTVELFGVDSCRATI